MKIERDLKKLEREALELEETGRRELEEFRRIPAVYGDREIRTEEIMLPMSDGVRLHTFLIRPEGVDRLPALLQRTPYANQVDSLLEQLREFARHGFACILQYCRGTEKSEGQWVPNVNERGDGLDTVGWLADQEWVTSIGYFGASYLSLTGWVMMDALPDKVKGMYLSVYGTDRFVSAYQDGAFRQDILTAWAQDNAGIPVNCDFYEAYNYRPQTSVDRDMWGADLPWYRDWITHTDHDDPYWKTGFWDMLKKMPAKVKIPIVFEEGWYDHHLGSSLAGYATMPEEVKKNCLLRIGSWKHMKQPCLEGKDCPNLQNGSILPVYDFFRGVLLGETEFEPGVLFYRIGEDKWERLAQWPVDAKTADLSLDCRSGKLLFAAPESQGSTSYTYDPEDPVITLGAESCLHSMDLVGSFLQPEPGYRADVLSFVSDPLDKDLKILGKISADLTVSSDAEDTAFTMKVMEVTPEGKSYNIRSGITTLGYRGHSEKRQTYAPGACVRVNIDSWDISWTVKAGSRIRVDISSSDFPQYSIHTNYPGVWAEQTGTKKAVQTVYSGAETPSVLHIPVCQSDNR